MAVFTLDIAPITFFLIFCTAASGDAAKYPLIFFKISVPTAKNKTSKKNHKMGFFQIGGGISGDFPICCVPLINQDLYDFEDYKIVDFWKYFCQKPDLLPQHFEGFDEISAE